MSTVKVHAGDFWQADGVYYNGTLALRNNKNWLLGEQIPVTEISSLEMASEESVKRIGGGIGWGIAATALFGPVGILAGLAVGCMNKKKVTFVAQFKDRRRLLATTDGNAFRDMRARLFQEKRDAAWNALSSIGSSQHQTD